MPKVFKLLFTLCSAILCINLAHATSNQPTTFLGPTLTGTYASWMSPISAFSILGEVAPKNYRLNLTAGFKIDDVSRIKLSAEYLVQRINYSFVLGDEQRWMQQFAGGMLYEYFVGCSKDHSIEIGGYGSYAPNRNLGVESGEINYFNPAGIVTTTYTSNRVIAGSAGYGFLGGVNFYLWPGSTVGVDLRYDDISYRRRFEPSYDAHGVGATVKLRQLLGDHMRVDLLGELRKPFANYQASFNWDNITWHGRWGAGVFGRYTYGRTLLPNTWNAGLNLDYFVDCTPAIIGDMKHERTVGTVETDFINWVHDPAVYMPQVLAIADERGRCTGAPPPLAVGSIPDQGTVLAFNSVSFNAAPYFSGSNLIYTISASPNFTAFGDIYAIQSTTGQVYLYNSGTGPTPEFFPMTFTITATNACGSATQTFTATFDKSNA